MTRRRRAALAALVCACRFGIASAQSEPPADDAGAFSFAVVGSDAAGEAVAAETIRAIDGTAARFVVHFELSAPSRASCGDATLDRRRRMLDASAKAVVPVPSGSEWADCGDAAVDPFERLQRVDDVLFGAEQSLGQAPLPWLRQSALPRYRRYRENVRWQVGRVLFATTNVPDGNNDFRFGAGRNGEFEERTVANRAWLERTFRLAAERRLLGVVLFVDAAPRFGASLRAPDLRGRDRDGYYEWKLALREHAATFKGRVLLVQGHAAPGTPPPPAFDHPLRDAGGRPIEPLARVVVPDPGGESRWLRIDVDPADPKLFRASIGRAFDDPSGELYGPARVR